MNIDFTKIMTFKQFETCYLDIYNNTETYNKFLKESFYFHNKIKDKVNDAHPKFHPPVNAHTRLNIVSDKLRTSCRENDFYKNMVIINSIFNNENFLEILNLYSIDIDYFISSLNRTILMSKIKKSSLQNDYIENTIKLLYNYYGYDKSILYITKIYELKILKDLELQDVSKKTK